MLDTGLVFITKPCHIGNAYVPTKLEHVRVSAGSASSVEYSFLKVIVKQVL